MKKIKFRFSEIYDIFELHEQYFNEYKDYNDTEEENGYCLSVVNYRIVIPALHVSFREADLFKLDSAEDPEEDDEWEAQCSVYLEYEENEKDYRKWLIYYTGFLEYIVLEKCRKYDFPEDEMGELDCYIEFDTKKSQKAN